MAPNPLIEIRGGRPAMAASLRYAEANPPALTDVIEATGIMVCRNLSRALTRLL